MASLQQTFSGHPDHLGNIARLLWSARNVASAARQESQGWADTNPDLVKGVTPMFGRGQIFGRELQRRATSRLPRRFQRQLLGSRDYWLTGQSTVDPLMGVGKDTKSGGAMRLLPEYQNIAHPDEKAYRSNASKLPKAPSTTNTSSNQKGTVVRDQKLGNFLAAVALSLSSSFNSINKKLDEANEGIIVAKDGIADTHKKLEHHSDSLESKLDDIIDALRFANTQEKVQKDQRQADSKAAEDAKATDLSNANAVLMQDMDRQEIRQMQMEDIAEDDRGPIGDPWEDPKEKQLNLQGFEEGGIASGPDSGYLAVLHGDEAVIPLDNNYTQGETSALTNPVTPNTPMASNTMPMMERGNNLDSMNPKMLPWKGLARPSISSSTNVNVGGSSVGGTDLAAAIQLPSKAAGIVTMGLMGEVLKNAKLPPGVTAHIKNISSPIASAFGIPDIVSEDLTEDSEFMQNQKRQEVLSATRGREGRERGVLGQIVDFMRGKISGTGGGGNVIYNRTSGGTGGGNIAWGKKKQKVINSKSDFGAIKRRTATTDAYMVEAGMLDPSAFESKYGISADKWLRLPDYPTDQSSLDSSIFTKNLSYENAFDYKQIGSPQYGLKTSEIAYNMSMEDEVKGIVEGLADPDSQVVLNNQTAHKDSDNQIEHSSIANRGNPLHSGTYLGAYSV